MAKAKRKARRVEAKWSSWFRQYVAGNGNPEGMCEEGAAIYRYIISCEKAGLTPAQVWENAHQEWTEQIYEYEDAEGSVDDAHTIVSNLLRGYAHILEPAAVKVFQEEERRLQALEKENYSGHKGKVPVLSVKAGKVILEWEAKGKK